MATIQEILDNINASKSNNINNNSFIDLMRQISGNPEDATAPVNDANSIYGHIVQMYTELFDGSTNYEEIVANIDAIRDVFNNLAIINSLNDIKVALESIFADKSTLDSIFADKLTLDSLYADKSTLDSLFADKIKFDRIYSSIDNIDRVHQSIDNIDTAIESAANINILANSIQSVIATAAIDAEVVIVANSAPEIITLADNINTLNEIYTNRDEIYAADNNATVATTKAIEASNSATIATTRASEASASALAASTASNTSTTKATESAASAVLANTSAVSANTSAASASSKATIATTKANEASQSAANALASEQVASTSASNALVSENAAATSESNASTSEANALTYSQNALASQVAAELAETHAETAKVNAETAEANAVIAETAAESAQASAEAAQSSAESAQASATASANSATASAASASSSAIDAQSSEDDAETSATASAASALAASNSASSANTSANTATSQASIATTKASEASTSASNALTSESNASTSESNAATSASNALTSANNASSSASAAATSESNSATSESNASTSASNASVSASISTTKATEAATSASTALGYKNDVSAMKLAVETLYDAFDDRFLGTKISDPIVDNDGDAILDGAMYFDTTTNVMKVYDIDTTSWYKIPQKYLSQLLDVELTSIATGHMLKWDGENWINYLITKSDVGLSNVDNTSDANKPVSTATQTALNLKVAITDIRDNLTSFDTNKPLSANQGKILKGLIDDINTILASDDTTLDQIQEIVNFIKQNKTDLDTLGISNIAGLQTALDNKVDDSQVLTNVPSGAKFTDTVYTHPSTHPASMITEDTTHRFATDSEKSTWNAKANTSVVTTTANGLMSSTDKSKLDGIATGAQVNVATDLSLGTATATTIPLNSSTGTDVTLPAVTTTTAGLMGSSDKTKLDGIAANANNYSLPVASASVLGGVKAGTNVSIDANGVISANDSSVAWSEVTSKPTTLSGYGISDLTSHNSANPIDPANTTVNAIGYTIPVSLFGQQDGGLINTAYSTEWQSQIFQDFRTGQIALRGKNSGTWTGWRTVLDSENYNSYSPSKTGTGASGTWGINITGSAETASHTPTLSALQNYVWSASTTPTGYPLGVQTSFVNPEGGFPDYGSVVNVKTYSGGGGSLQLYVPYGPTNGGNTLKVRFGNYNVNLGNSWTNWKTLITDENISSYNAGSASIPTGGIIMWSGSVSSIPAGWYLCNGSNGTPNLMDRFVVGAGSAYAVGATGGSANAVVVSHTHTASTDAQGNHSHGAWTDSQGSHTHSQTLYNGGAVVATGSTRFASSGNYDRPGTGTIGAAGSHSHNVSMDAAGSHVHNIAVSTNGESGTNKNLPPYYALCYIMKT